jgi:hypothetical protein
MAQGGTEMAESSHMVAAFDDYADAQSAVDARTPNKRPSHGDWNAHCGTDVSASWSSTSGCRLPTRHRPAATWQA